MRELSLKLRTLFNFDRLGIALSFICAIHCLLTPMILLSLPIVARYYVAHPLFHWVLALLILPIGSFAFFQGYRHHRKTSVFLLGIPGLLIVSIVPTFFHAYLNIWLEPLLMLAGSFLLIMAHWTNRRSCSCEIHRI